MSALERFKFASAKSQIFSFAGRMSLYRRLESFARAGISVQELVEGNWERARRRKQSTQLVWGRILKSLRRADDTGPGSVIAQYVPMIEGQIIRAAESGNRLAEGFGQAAYMATGAKRLRAAIIKPLIYPAVLAILLVAYVLMLVGQVLPVVETMYDVELWPPISQSFNSFGILIRKWGLAAFIVVIAGLALSLVSLPRLGADKSINRIDDASLDRVGETFRQPIKVSGFRRFLDKAFPPWSIYRIYHGSGFLLMLASITKSGQAPSEALKTIFLTARSSWLQTHYSEMIRRMQSGEGVGEAVRTGLLLQSTEDDIEDFSRANALTENLSIMGTEAIEDAIANLQKIGDGLRNLFLFLVVGVLGWGISAFILAIIQFRSLSASGLL